MVKVRKDPPTEVSVEGDSIVESSSDSQMELE
jgi:hypothetical protein